MPFKSLLFLILTICTLGQGDWSTIKCTDTGYDNPNTDPSTRWQYAQAEAAWQQAINSWNSGTNNPNRFSFSVYMGHQLGSSENIVCDDHTANNNCDGQSICGAGIPAAFDAIFRSFAVIHNIHAIIYDGITNAMVDMGGQMGDFSARFAPQVPEINHNANIGDIILNFLAAAVALTSAATFNLLIGESVLKITKDIVGPLLTATAVTAGSFIKSKQISGNPLGTLNSMNDLLSSTGSMWEEITAKALGGLFNGSTQSIDTLHSLIQNGQLFNAVLPNSEDIKNNVKRTMFGYLIQVAWQISNLNPQPAILQTGLPCSSQFDGFPSNTWVCYEGQGYYLINQNLDGCCRPQTLPGGDALIDNTVYFLNTTDIVVGSLAGYTQNHYQNGWQTLDPSNEQVINGILMEGSIDVPGFMNVNVYPINQLEGTVQNCLHV